MFIGKRIRKFRLKKKLTLQYLAEQSDLTHTHLSNIEHGVHMPTLNTLISIMNALQINYSILADDSQDDSVFANSIIDKLQDASEEELKFFIELLEIIKRDKE